jgi:thiol-disulfide isomerase/thioredoxin
MKRFPAAIYVVLLLGLAACATRQKPQDASWQTLATTAVHNIALQHKGKNAYIETDKTPISLLVFLSPECPLCKNYSLVLNTLYQKYNDSIRFYGIVPGRTYSEEEIQRFVDDYKIQFPVYTDLQKKLSNRVNATTTPEVVLLNQAGNIVYRGAIDDWVQALGQKKAKPEQHFLEDAVTQYLQNKPVSIKQTTPIGCLINEF